MTPLKMINIGASAKETNNSTNLTTDEKVSSGNTAPVSSLSSPTLRLLVVSVLTTSLLEVTMVFRPSIVLLGPLAGTATINKRR